MANFDFDYARRQMVELQLKRRGVCDAAVLAAMAEVPREVFVSEHYAEHAYMDAPLPIEAEQTISQPFVVAMMLEAAELTARDRVLEIGAGSGYAAAVLSRIAADVIAVERIVELVEPAAARMRALGYANVDVRLGDGTQGWPARAPYDAILASAGGPAIPDTLKRQLALGGRLVMPVGDTTRAQRLIKLTRIDLDDFVEKELGHVAFVPLIGVHGWRESDDVRRPP